MCSAETRFMYSCPSLPQPKTFALWNESNAMRALLINLLRSMRGFSFNQVQVSRFYPQKLISTSKLQMQRHLDETRAADGVCERAQMSNRRNCISYRRAGKARGRRVTESVEINAIVGNIEARVIEDIEGVHVVPQRKSFRQLEILEGAEIETVL